MSFNWQFSTFSASIYGGIVLAAVTTIATILLISSKLWKIPTKFQTRDTDTPSHKQSHKDTGNENASSIKISQESSNFQISETNANVILNGEGRFTKMQRNLICDCIADSPEIHSLREHALAESVMSLLPRAEATFRDYQSKTKSGTCFKGTRLALLREMADCVTGSSGSRIYVLSGQAGTGKSTIALTIASRAAELNLLGASFFFSQDKNCNNAKIFFTTIAHQLCAYNETFAKALGDVLKTRDGPVGDPQHPLGQLEVLILEPLRSIVQSRPRPILVVVDALDECIEEDRYYILIGLNRLVQDLPSFKIILTTRPLPLFDRFRDNQSDQDIFCQQTIEHKVVDGDIRRYLNHCLSIDNVQKRNPTWEWSSSDKEIDSLVRIAGRFFVIASTAVRYILDKNASDPAAQMQKLLYTSVHDGTPFNEVDHFYTVILRNLIPANDGSDDEIHLYQSVVGAIILVQHPLPVSALAHLIDINEDDMRTVIDNLQCVILLDGDDDVPRIYHKSFSDYVTDQGRCKESHLRIDPRVHHTQIATRCFEIMDRYLKYNITALGDSSQLMNNEDALKEDGITDEKLEEYIPQHLRYACVYWADHLAAADIEDADLMNGLAKFADEHILHWFEVLSLIGKLELAYRAVHVALGLLKLTSSDLYQLLSDTLRFILKFSEPIQRSALQTYHTALCFTPTDSLLYCRYNKEAIHKCSVEGEPKNWDPLFADLTHGESVQVVKFSPDVSLMISYSEKFQDQDTKRQGKLKIWNASTGTLVSMISGHAFAIANDLSAVASAKDNIITCYYVIGLNKDVKGTTKTLTTLSKIEKLALSSESTRIAAGLSDGSVWLWNLGNGELVDSFDGFGLESCHRPLSQLEFSPDGTRLVYSSANGIIKLRDGINGRFIADLQSGSTPGLFLISSNGTRIASYSSKSWITSKLSLWNSESGTLIGDPQDIFISVLAISANGSLLATLDNRNKVTLWNAQGGSLTQVDVLCPESCVDLLAFSPNNILTIATRDNITLYNAKTLSLVCSLPFDELPTSLAFSQDSTRLAVGSGKGRVYLWDIDAFTLHSKEETNTQTGLVRVTVLVLSRDCLRLACGFKDGTVQLWATTPAKQQIASHGRTHTLQIEALAFSSDGGLFASGSKDGTIKLWSGEDGSSRGTLKAADEACVLALSNSVLVAARRHGVTLWCLNTQKVIHLFSLADHEPSSVSIAENDGLIAVACRDLCFGAYLQDRSFRVTLLDPVNHKTIITIKVSSNIRTMAFLPNNEHLVTQCKDGSFLSFNLTNKHLTKGTTPEHLVHLPNISLWHGVPIWHCQGEEQDHFSALFSQDKSPMPVLWIPKHLFVTAYAQGPSVIALGRGDGGVILLRLPTNHIG